MPCAIWVRADMTRDGSPKVSRKPGSAGRSISRLRPLTSQSGLRFAPATADDRPSVRHPAKLGFGKSPKGACHYGIACLRTAGQSVLPCGCHAVPAPTGQGKQTGAARRARAPGALSVRLWGPTACARFWVCSGSWLGTASAPSHAGACSLALRACRAARRAACFSTNRKQEGKLSARKAGPIFWPRPSEPEGRLRGVRAKLRWHATPGPRASPPCLLNAQPRNAGPASRYGTASARPVGARQAGHATRTQSSRARGVLACRRPSTTARGNRRWHGTLWSRFSPGVSCRA